MDFKPLGNSPRWQVPTYLIYNLYIEAVENNASRMHLDYLKEVDNNGY